MSAAVAHSEIDVLIQDTLILIHDKVIWISLWGTALAISNVTFLIASFSNKKNLLQIYILFSIIKEIRENALIMMSQLPV